MEEKIGIIIVDDNEHRLDELKAKFERSKEPRFTVTAIGSPYEAFDYLTEHEGEIEFALVDHLLTRTARRPRNRSDLPSLRNGVQWTHEVSQRWANISVILFTGEEEITDEDQWRGLAAGARRYVNVTVAPKTIDRKLIAEVRELREIEARLAEVDASMRRMEVLQRAVKVGIDVVDSQFKVLFQNEDYKEIVGESGNAHFFCCARYHHRPWPPCPGCLTHKCLNTPRPEDGQPAHIHERNFYSPVYPDGKKTFKYLHVWAEPIYSTGKDRWPIAVKESIIDLTDGATIERMGLKEHLDILLQAITETTREQHPPHRVPFSPDGRWRQRDPRPRFTRARVHQVFQNSDSFSIKGLAKRGSLPVGIEEIQFQPNEKAVEAIQQEEGIAIHVGDIRAFIHNYEGIRDALGIRDEDPLVYALFDSKHNWIGVLAVDCEEDNRKSPPLDAADVATLQPYAEEIARILERKIGAEHLGDGKAVILDTVQARIAAATTPNDALQTVIDGIVGQSGIDMGHIRLINGEQAVLAAGKGAYSDVAERVLPISHPSSLTARVARTGLPVIVNRRPDPRIERAIESMNEDGRAILEPVNSHGVFPLKVFGDVLGVLVLQGEKPNVFTDSMILLCTRLAEIASYALHDRMLEVAAAERHSTEVWRRAAATFSHRIGNSLPVAQWHLLEICQTEGIEPQVAASAAAALEEVNRAQDLAVRLRERAKKKVVDLAEHDAREVFEAIAARVRTVVGRTGTITEQINVNPGTIMLIDASALSDAMLALAKDSVKFHPSETPAITVSVRQSRGMGGHAQLLITYADDGPGVSDHEKERIFEPFYSTIDTGTGVGLTDVRDTIEAHGGEIRENGTPGKGVLFEITLPIQDRKDKD